MEVQLLRSLERASLDHQPVEWCPVRLVREEKHQSVHVPAGTFETYVMSAEIRDERTWHFNVETDPSNRIIRWECSDGQKAEMIGNQRLKYWVLNDNASISALQKIGLTSRSVNTR